MNELQSLLEKLNEMDDSTVLTVGRLKDVIVQVMKDNSVHDIGSIKDYEDQH